MHTRLPLPEMRIFSLRIMNFQTSSVQSSGAQDDRGGMNTRSQPSMDAVYPILDGKAVYVALSGDQSTLRATQIYRKVAFWLMAKGNRSFLVDLRHAYYPENALDRIIGRVEWIGRLLPRCRVALLHRGEDKRALMALYQSNRRQGNETIVVTSPEAAHAFLAREITFEDDVVFVDELGRPASETD